VRSGLEQAIFVLADCLRLVEADTADLASRLVEAGWERLLAAADSQRLSNILALRLQQRHLVPRIPAIRLADGRVTIPAALAQRLDSHAAVRASQRARLFELIEALNKNDITPMLLKGSRSLWFNSPDWRAMRDLDLLVPRKDIARAQKTAVALGFKEQNGVPLGHHHKPNLYRDDLPGWVEFHHHAGVAQLELLIPTTELWKAANRLSSEAREVYMLPQPLHILHSMLHHHVGHWWDQHENNISMKGLYEFAAETVSLAEDQQRQLTQRAARHPRILAILELWFAAATDLYGMPSVSGLSVQPDASQWWSKRRGQLCDLPRAPTLGLRDELAAATQAERLARVGDPVLRHRWPAWLATRRSFVQRPRLLRLIPPRAPAP
jgi:hypothetical protein